MPINLPEKFRCGRIAQLQAGQMQKDRKRETSPPSCAERRWVVGKKEKMGNSFLVVSEVGLGENYQRDILCSLTN